MKRPPRRALGRNVRAESVRVTGQHIYWVYGLLVARLRREVTWNEFSDLTGISLRQVRYMRFNEHPGGGALGSRSAASAEAGANDSSVRFSSHPRE